MKKKRKTLKDVFGWDAVGQNPTGRIRKSSARQRRKKDRKLFGGTPWDKEGS